MNLKPEIQIVFHKKDYFVKDTDKVCCTLYSPIFGETWKHLYWPVISKKEFLKSETHAILVPFGKNPVCSERLKICLSGSKIQLAQNLATGGEISSNPRLLSGFKLLKASSNS